MLVFSRQEQEEIIVSDFVSIEVVEIDKGQVRLAINAQKGVQVDRAELYHQKNINNPNRDLAWVQDLGGQFNLYSNGNLILSRRVGEEIKIGADVTIRVASIKKGKARLGVEILEDPEQTATPINRYEIFEDKLESNTLFPSAA